MTKTKNNKLRDLTIFFLVVALLFYPYNASIMPSLKIGQKVLCAIIPMLVFLLLLLTYNKKVTKWSITVFLITLLITIITLVNNYYIKEDRASIAILYICYLFVPFIISKTEKYNLIDIIEKTIELFSYEHITATLFIQFFPNIYERVIFPWVSQGKRVLADAFFTKGYNAGLTTHYSTNGMYLATATLFFFSKYAQDKSKKNLIILIISCISLLLTAKRAHILFTIFSIFILMIINNKDKISKKAIKIILIIAFIIISIIFLSSFMPQLLGFINRFEETAAKGDITAGRSQLYELAINNYKNHKLLGNGWGSYTYFYHIYLYNPNAYRAYDYLGAHNVFLQLLCECGIIGTTFFCYLGTIILKNTIKVYNSKKGNKLIFSLSYQLFFLMYCMTGNPLYDVPCYSIYFIAIGISLYYYKKEILLKRKAD